ncbi:rRNA pseudouridine synthase [Candidatus Woesearchaeota archaeon]|nr:rRNA pseudouridine synthase [Candidatus Woesearchaeota archaeon]
MMYEKKKAKGSKTLDQRNTEDAREEHRVQKLISNWGYCSRRKAEALIEQGKVTINGKVAVLGDKASEKDNILAEGNWVRPERKIYVMFNKPRHCATALEDKFQKTIMSYIHLKERVFPIGRLDFNTTGLLLLTNDGDFANQIMHPRYEIKKTYAVELDRMIDTRSIKRIERGLELDDGMTAPARVEKLQRNKIEVTIHEGKNRIIRRMMKLLGYHVVSLERVRIGRLELGNLPVGKTRPLTEEDKQKIFS